MILGKSKLISVYSKIKIKKDSVFSAYFLVYNPAFFYPCCPAIKSQLITWKKFSRYAPLLF
ncbi:MAG: hypothetical protein Q4B28_06980, partial [bacterium]|nr:hypothetical protein [bacterium]